VLLLLLEAGTSRGVAHACCVLLLPQLTPWLLLLLLSPEVNPRACSPVVLPAAAAAAAGAAAAADHSPAAEWSGPLCPRLAQLLQHLPVLLLLCWLPWRHSVLALALLSRPLLLLLPVLSAWVQSRTVR
jgi:hypothetical protein